MTNITIQEEGNMMVAYLKGRLDTPATPDAERALNPLFHCDDKDIIFDCKKLDYISSSGLRLFLDILKHSKAHEHHVFIKNISAPIREAFVLTGFINLFEYI